MSRFTKPVQLPVGEGILGFHCGVELVDRWAAEHSAHVRRRGAAVVDSVDASSRSFYGRFGFSELGVTGRMALKLPVAEER